MPAIVSKPTTRKHVCTFDELGERQKHNAREWMREQEAQDFDTDYLYESIETAAGILGIEIAANNARMPKIYWSGFWSQGDGASWEGSYSHAPGAAAKIRHEFPCETDLHEIADGLTALQAGYKVATKNWLSAKVMQHGRSVHKMTMDIEVEDSETGDPPEDAGIDKRLLDLMRDFADWIYESLEKEYEYRTSDESIEETIRANAYTFKAATGEFAGRN